MKTKTSIIPVFISHKGCPNDCAFCNQKRIAGADGSFHPDQMEAYIEPYLSTIPKSHVKEIAFYGGSFTGITETLQEAFLSCAHAYKKEKSIDKIRLSTRPDYITEPVVKRLKKFEVDLVELGCQSFSNEVLIATNRGHQSADITNAIVMLRDAKLQYGIQLMVGLPEDTPMRFKNSVEQAIALKPSVVRIYPTLVVKDTLLEKWYTCGRYQPLSLDEAVDYSAYAYNAFSNASIEVLRVGLQKTDEIEMGRGLVAGPFHPAFGELVIGRLHQWALLDAVGYCSGKKVLVEISKSTQSWLTGHKKHYCESYKKWLQDNEITIKGNPSLAPFELKVLVEGETVEVKVISNNRGEHVFKKN